MSNQSLEKSLEDAIDEFKCYNNRTESLYKRTSTCFQDILKSMDMGLSEEEDTDTLIPFSQLYEVERELQKSPSVFFIGERNCGKSSIINELLRQSSLPVDENPCTARIVRIKYADEPYASLVGSNGEEVGRKTPKRKKIPKEFIVVSDRDRENENELDATVEVGLNHKLLRSGMELIDSPGKGESDVLDKVLDGYLEKGNVPLFVYVIDGNNNLRKSDKQTLSFLKDKFPQCLIMFVCNKVDTTKEAKEFDTDSDDSDDDDDDDKDDDKDGEDEDDDEEETKGDKGAKVLIQLEKSNFLPKNSLGTPSLYHAISAKEVREERRSQDREERRSQDRSESEASRRFKRFESDLQHFLGNVMKTQTRKVVQKLLVLQESVVNIVQVQRTLITEQASILPQVIKKGNDVEIKIFESLSLLTFTSEEAKEKLVDSVRGVKRECLHDAEVYKPQSLRQLKSGAETMVKTDLPELTAELATLLSFDIAFQCFLSDMKGGILERMCNSIGSFVESTMNELVSDLTKDIIAFSEDLAHPVVSRILEDCYDIQFLEVKAEADQLIQTVLNGLLDSIKEAVSIALRREISGPLSSSDMSDFTGRDVQKPANRKVIVSSLVDTIKEEKVANAVGEACCNRLATMHELFSTAMSKLSSLQNNFANCHVASRLEQFRVNYTPEIRTLAVEGMALQNMQHRGPVELGSIIATTSKGIIYDCISECWCRVSPSGQCAVKVLKRGNFPRDEAIWKQTAVDLVNMMDMIQKLRGSHPNLLRLFGWVFPQPDVLYVVMEKAERGLLSALWSGLPRLIRMNVAVDVARGLKAIHGINYIYEDLKPENILLMTDGTAKINLTKPEFPYDMTPLGAPFHLSPEMYQHHGTGQLSYPSYDIYAFGMLLWVLCEGSGMQRPPVYQQLETNEDMKKAVEKNIFPGRLPMISDACWDLMWSCWHRRETIRMESVVANMEEIRNSCWQES